MLQSVEIKAIEGLLADYELDVNAGNGTGIPFEEWVDILLEW